MKVGDLITCINGTTVKSVQGFQRVLHDLKVSVGSPVTLGLGRGARGAQAMTATLATTAEVRPARSPAPAPHRLNPSGPGAGPKKP